MKYIMNEAERQKSDEKNPETDQKWQIVRTQIYWFMGWVEEEKRYKERNQQKGRERR